MDWAESVTVFLPTTLLFQNCIRNNEKSYFFPTCVRPSPFALQHVESTGQSAVLFVVSSWTHVLLVVT